MLALENFGERNLPKRAKKFFCAGSWPPAVNFSHPHPPVFSCGFLNQTGTMPLTEVNSCKLLIATD